MQITKRFQAALVFGIIMTIFNVGWDLATENNNTSEHITRSIVSGIIGGAIGGLLFGWLDGFLGKSKDHKSGNQRN